MDTKVDKFKTCGSKLTNYIVVRGIHLQLVGLLMIQIL